MWAETRHQFESSIWAIVRDVETCRPALVLAVHFSFTTIKDSVAQCHAPFHAMVWLVSLGMWNSLWLGWLGSSSCTTACRGPPCVLVCAVLFSPLSVLRRYCPLLLLGFLTCSSFLLFPTGNQTFQLSAISEGQINMSSNSHTAEDTKACHSQKLPLQKSKKENVGVPDTLIDLWDASSKTAVMSA